ncbi:hypothetical protein ROLI_020570 [Roseobacter fucihabitans]|uniref:Uncharacterized protein n=1 Tax=Roseobacter fucihabitans TaxID=1537242 RepID=A0ABZ2BUX2_9RHOB|nr:hypothetical protein [Roseobacter litoralis]MBC6966528.1 hypothetical protein [Roseobacter litoralis]
MIRAKCKRRAVALFSLVVWVTLSATSPTLAQTVVGRSVVDGQKVELLSDKTWRLTDPDSAVAACDSLPLGVSFCAGTDWKPTTPPSNEIAAQYRFDDRNYAQMILEAVGTQDGMSTEFMRKAMINNAASVAGLREQDVAILDVRDVTLGDLPGEMVVYQLGLEGVDVVFLNTIVVLPQRTFQLMTFAVGKQKTPEMERLHVDFLSRVKIE